MWIATNVGVTLPLYVKGENWRSAKFVYFSAVIELLINVIHFYVDLTQMNTYEIGLASSIPSTVYTIVFPFAGIMMDYCSNQKSISLTKVGIPVCQVNGWKDLEFLKARNQFQKSGFFARFFFHSSCLFLA